MSILRVHGVLFQLWEYVLDCSTNVSPGWRTPLLALFLPWAFEVDRFASDLGWDD